MRWLKQLEPIVLEQSSEIPYVILEDGVHLCFDNFYAEPQKTLMEHFASRKEGGDYYIRFTAHKNDIKQQSTNYFRLQEFPTVIPFDNILVLNDTIFDGRIIKATVETDGSPAKIAIIKSDYLQEIDDSEFQEIVESFDNFDHRFLLVGQEIQPQERLLEDSVDMIHHLTWARTCVDIVDRICPKPKRKYCWTRTTPELSITAFGINDNQEYDSIYKCLDNIGVPEKEIIWG